MSLVFHTEEMNNISFSHSILAKKRQDMCVHVVPCHVSLAVDHPVDLLTLCRVVWFPLQLTYMWMEQWNKAMPLFNDFNNQTTDAPIIQ